jgi:hypothetical protein
LHRPILVGILFYISCWKWDVRHELPCLVFFYWEEVSWTFLPGVAWNCDSPFLSLLHSWSDRRQVSWHPVTGWDGSHELIVKVVLTLWSCQSQHPQ